MDVSISDNPNISKGIEGVKITGEITEEYQDILSSEAVEFIVKLHKNCP